VACWPSRFLPSACRAPAWVARWRRTSKRWRFPKVRVRRPGHCESNAFVELCAYQRRCYSATYDDDEARWQPGDCGPTMSSVPPTRWTPSRIRWVDRTLGTSTGATRVETDEGPAYAKLLGNPEGPQALFCDWVGTRAAAWLGLPTFELAVVEVQEARLVTYDNGTESVAGPAFLAREDPGTTWGGTTDELDYIENSDALAGLIVLDTWLLNCDRYRPEGGRVRRNTRNVFLSQRGAGKGKLRVVAMDHTHCFTCGAPLTTAIRSIDRAQDTRVYGHFPEFRRHVTHVAVERFSLRLLELTRPVAQGFMDGAPRAWDIRDEVRGALGDFLRDRAVFLGERRLRAMLMDQGVLQPELDV
jgi:hypothetical protein